MANKDELPPPKLVISREEAQQRIEEQIERGRGIQNLEIRDRNELENARSKQYRWRDYNVELLKRIFDNKLMAEEFDSPLSMISVLREPNLAQDVKEFQRDTGKLISRLESILGRLELIPEPNTVKILSKGKVDFGTDVFIVHGHDESAKEATARVIKELVLKPIILHERPNGGRTIIEKFEQETANIGFAVILLTPDDTCNVGKNEVKRARQNVIFELGFFVGKLGRDRVCALYKEGVEIPSDFQGVLYVPMDDYGSWKYALGKEIRNAGIEVDLNNL